MAPSTAPCPVPIGWALPGESGNPSDAVFPLGEMSPDSAVPASDAERAWAMQLEEMQAQAVAATQSSDAERAWAMQLEEQAGAAIQSSGSDCVFDLRQTPAGYWLADPVWGEVHYVDHEPTRCQTCCFACCPCWTVGCGGTAPFLGSHQLPLGPEHAKRVWSRFLCSFSMLVSVLQLVALIVSVAIGGGFASFEKNSMLGPHPHVFDTMGAKNAARVLEYGEWFRLVTPMLLHSGLVHLVTNVFVQLKLGVLLEVLWGHDTWLVIYITSGIYGNLASCVLLPDTLGVGASGGICGLVGAGIVFLLMTWRQTSPNDIAERNVQLSALAITTVLTGILSTLPLVDFAAHAGGFVEGMLVGTAIFASRAQDRSSCFRRAMQFLGAFLALSLFVASGVYLLLTVKPDSDLLTLCRPRDC